MTEIGGNLRKRNKLHVLACNPNGKINIHEYILIYTIECIKKHIRNRGLSLGAFCICILHAILNWELPLSQDGQIRKGKMENSQVIW